MKIYLFTYGMLTNKSIMDPEACLVGAATLQDWQFEMLIYANVLPAPGKQAGGVLWEINADILRDCDYREGYPTTYNRVMVEVECNDEKYPCWVYTLTKKGRDSYKKHQTSSYYFDTVLEGYKQHGVATSQVVNAVLPSLVD